MEYLASLRAPALESHGITGWNYGVADIVRFHELDALNHVNNVVFLQWFETIRVRYVVEYGLTTYSDTTHDPQLVVRAQDANYFAPMYQNESYIVTARTRLVKPSSLIMNYGVYVGTECRADGSCVVISLEQDGKTRRPHHPHAIHAMVSQDGALTEGIAP